ncbi:MAG: AzlC family ABC transporter permease, partial [Clostridia bacterium]|nr:AzlC family ABC transporter permease [Clostridia bacterium]
ALGITAKNAGLTALQAGIASFLLNASAGEYAGFTLIAATATYGEVALMTLITNARYFLMSCSLSQKLDQSVSVWHRLLIGFDVTDEIFGVSMAVPGKLCPYYTYGVMALSMPGWAGGTVLGVLAGSILPLRVVSALSVGLFGMFIAIVVPPARQNKVIAALIPICFGLSFVVDRLPLLSGVSTGVKTIVLTVVLSVAAALLFPIKEQKEADQ